MRHDGPHLMTLSRLFVGGRVESTKCQAEGCLATTREGKPYCSDHVERMPYVARLVEDLERQQAEHERVRTRRDAAIDPDGVTAREIILHLRTQGDRTLQRLAKELQLEHLVVDRYVAALRRAGRVTLGLTSRHATLVHLLSEGERAGAEGRVPEASVVRAVKRGRRPAAPAVAQPQALVAQAEHAA